MSVVSIERIGDVEDNTVITNTGRMVNTKNDHQIDFSQIGHRIKAVRQTLEMSQEALARDLGISTATLNRYEKGHRKDVPVPILTKLSEMANVASDWLLSGQGSMSAGAPPDIPEQPQAASNEPMLTANSATWRAYLDKAREAVHWKARYEELKRQHEAMMALLTAALDRQQMRDRAADAASHRPASGE